MRRSIQRNEISNPERVLLRMIKDYVGGRLDNNRVLYRASVVDVDLEGGQFEEDPPNPRNSIRARIITNGLSSALTDDDLPVFWPMFPHIQLPVKENEHVYVVFEDASRQHGIWLTRIPERNDIDSTNYVEGTKAYLENEGVKPSNVDRLVACTPDNPTIVPVADDFTIEDVKNFVGRTGDHVIYGSNGTVIVLGRDRPTDADSGEASSAGTIDIVVGRAKDVDMDAINDKSRVYVTQNTNVDQNFGMKGYAWKDDAGKLDDPSGLGAAVVAISDHIRVVARKSMKIVVEQGNLVIDGTNITIGNQADQHAVLGDQLTDLLSKVLEALMNHTHPTPSGPSGPSTAATDWGTAKGNLPNTLSTTVKVKG